MIDDSEPLVSAFKCTYMQTSHTHISYMQASHTYISHMQTSHTHILHTHGGLLTHIYHINMKDYLPEHGEGLPTGGSHIHITYMEDY